MVGNGQRRPVAARVAVAPGLSVTVIGTATFPPRGCRAGPRRRRHKAGGGARERRGRDPDPGHHGHGRGRRRSAVRPGVNAARRVEVPRRAARAPRGRVWSRVRRAHDAGWRSGVAAEHPAVAPVPAPAARRRAHRPRDGRGQRREGARCRRGMARRRRGGGQLHRDGRVHRSGRRDRRRRPSARRRDRQCRPHRPCHRRTRRPAVRMRRPGVSRSGDIRAVDRGAHGATAGDRVERDDRAVRGASRPGAVVGHALARSSARHGRGIGRPRLRRAVLCRGTG